jgi:hypothetical protein
MGMTNSSNNLTDFHGISLIAIWVVVILCAMLAIGSSWQRFADEHPQTSTCEVDSSLARCYR